MYSAPANPRVDPFATLLTIDPAHDDIDRALLNWAAWLKFSGPSQKESPMFRLYRSSAMARGSYGQTTRAAPAKREHAVNLEKIMRDLSELHHKLLEGWYLWNRQPGPLCKSLGIRYDELARALHDARTMAKNLMRARCGERWAAGL